MIAKFDFKVQNFTFTKGEDYTFRYNIIEGEELIFVTYTTHVKNYKKGKTIPYILILDTLEYQNILPNFWTKAELRIDKIDKIIDEQQ